MTTQNTATSKARKPTKAAAKSATSAAKKSAHQDSTKVASPSAAKRDIQKLQRAIVDGLEEVKAQDIVVFDTEHLSSLFERVIVASGTSNRQTKALAMSVLDAVREAGFPKPRVEGEANGEWIIVDCGQAVLHVMQPTYRSYYNLEELWGEKPVRLKFGAAKPVVAAEVSVTKEVAKPAASLRRSSAAKRGVEEAFPSKAQMAKTAASVAAAKKAAATSAATPKRKVVGTDAVVAKPRIKTLVVNAPVKPTAKKPAAKKTPAKKAPARKSAVRKA